MSHLKPFVPRKILALPTVESDGWQLKRYGILAHQRSYEPGVASSALAEAIERLPIPGDINDPSGNHGAGFQVIHFAEAAVVSPVFFETHASQNAMLGVVGSPSENLANFLQRIVPSEYCQPLSAMPEAGVICRRSPDATERTNIGVVSLILVAAIAILTAVAHMSCLLCERHVSGLKWLLKRLSDPQ